jgi:alpha-glucoside transport system substrate-binding protein
LIKKYKWLAAFAALSIVVAACGGGDGDGSTTVAGAGDLEGTTVNIFGAFVSPEQEAFEASIAPFEERTGIDIVYEGSGDFETQIPIRVEGGNAPDIAVFPQPGLANQFIDDYVDLTTFLAAEEVDAAFSPYLAGLVDRGDDSRVAGWLKVNSKSLIWYPVPEFEEAGYTIPATWDDLMALQDQILADGNTPWCLTMESAGATGWVATDWMEDLMLRTAGPDGYDQWVAGDITFTDPKVKQAAELFGEVLFTEGAVFGGRDFILSDAYQNAQLPMFEDPPACYLHRQGSFAASFFPEGVSAPDDTNIFPFPAIEEGLPPAALGGGDVFAMFEDRPEVRAVVEYFFTPEVGEIWAQQDAGFLSPHTEFDTSNYGNELQATIGESVKEALSAAAFRFDGSDAMPAAVGQGTFWTGMVQYIQNGPDNLDEVLDTIEASWPS